MSSVLEKLKKNSRIKEAEVLADSQYFGKVELTSTAVPMINVALSGSLNGGIASGLSVFAGPSKHFKTSYALLIASAYLEKHKDACLMFYDSEFGSPQAYFHSFGIDTNRVLHIPVKDVEELKFDLVNQLNDLDRKDKVFVIIDSIGNLASKKELEDAIDAKSVTDMSRAKSLKGLFRMVTPYLTIKDVPCIAVNHTYMELGMFPKAILSGGCFEEGTLIRMADGTNRAIDQVMIGDLVMTRDGPREVEHVWDPDTLEDGNPDCVEVTFEDGTTVVCSESHPFLVNGSWVEAKDLTNSMNIDTI
jgi:hypothetical protein